MAKKTKPKTEFRPLSNTAPKARTASVDTPPRLKVVKNGVETIHEPATREEYEALKRRMKATARGMRDAGIDYEALEEREVPEESETAAEELK